MSRPWSPAGTNRTPWTDVCELVSVVSVSDTEGYRTDTETKREIFCTFSRGAGRAEYYEAMKTGVRVSATVEIWEDDFQDERLLDHEGVRYQIGRVWPTGRGTLELSLEEVWR